ncbi:MAG: transporter [Elusimicrobiaceae bacterium]
MNNCFKCARYLLRYFALSVIFSASVLAGIENRPLNTAEATLLEPGHFSLAAGVQYLKQSDGSREYGIVTDLEYGFFKRFEVDLEVPFSRLTQGDAPDQSGLRDMSVWLGCNLAKEEQAYPALTAALSWKTTTGNQDKQLGTGENTYQGIVLASKTFGKTSAHFNGSYTFADNPALGWNLAVKHGITDKLTLAAEMYGQNDQKASGNNTTDGLIGAIYAFSPSVLLDLGIGRGFTSASPDLRITGGISCFW